MGKEGFSGPAQPGLHAGSLPLEEQAPIEQTTSQIIAPHEQGLELDLDLAPEAMQAQESNPLESPDPQTDFSAYSALDFTKIKEQLRNCDDRSRPLVCALL